ncbi:MAG: TonB-dependent receptor [Bacteroidota bacterium]|nr:TonB-dependent receptor [Bacteroidota bacterium]
MKLNRNVLSIFKNGQLKKCMRIMKLSSFLILFLTLQMSASVWSQTTTMSVKLKNSTLQELFLQIEKSSNYRFFYNNDEVDVSQRISVDAEEKTVGKILEAAFEGLPYSFKELENKLILIERNGAKPNPIGITMQQQKSVSGKVTDSSGASLPGVSVVVRGTTIGTITDADGKYSISNVPDNATLQFSFVGMKSQEVAVGNNATVNVTLEEETIGIDDVVVIGYGTKLKGELTGSISKVNNQVFEKRPITNTMNALQGALPGVVVTRGSGRPGGEDYSLQIRGYSSIAGSSPLVLIDGIPGDLNTLNPNDILDVTVLRDAAASIYGARAADGVLIVTTKSGKKGKPTVSYSGNFGIKVPQYTKTMTNTLQMAEMYDEGMRNIGQKGVTQEVFDKIKSNASPDINGGWMKYLENYPGFYGNTNWTDAVFGNGQQQSHNISISGGGDENDYLFSVGYKSDGGILNYGTDKSQLFNLRLNLGFKLFKIVNFETRTSIDNHIINEPSGLDGALLLTNVMWSYLPIYNPNGQLYSYQGYGNPIQTLLEGGLSKKDYSKISTSIKGDVKILKDLKLVMQMGLTLGRNDANANYRTFNQLNWAGGLQTVSNNPNNATYSNTKNLYGSSTAYLEYNKILFDKHRLNLMTGTSHEQNDFQSQSTTGYNFISNDLFTLNLADKTKTAYMNFTGSANDWSLNSYFGRFSYSFDKKYNVDITTRMDGSSKFAPSKRWSAVFPAVSASWNLSEEKFIQSLNTFDNLKLRASWGQSGNQNLSFGNYDYIALLSVSGNYPLGSPNVGLTGATSSIASESRTWETIQTTNAGIDFAVLASRLTGSLDYFIKQNNNMLVAVTLPATLGGTPPTQNFGKLETKGWDVSIGWNDTKGDFKYSISAIISDNKTNLIDVKGNDSYKEGLVYTRKGYPLNSYFGYQFDGYIQNTEEQTAYKKLGGVPSNIGLGDAKYKDLDGDGKITAFGDPALGTKGDMKYLGTLTPRYTYSSNINLSYKGFDLGIFLQGVGHRDFIRTSVVSRPLYFVWYQPSAWFYGKTWTPERTNAEFPRIIPGGMGFDALANWNYRYSDRVVDNVAYLRVKVLTLAYNLPQSVCSKLKMQSIRVYASGQDLFTVSKGTWGNSYDPEEQRSPDVHYYNTYPFSKVISFGTDIKF